MMTFESNFQILALYVKLIGPGRFMVNNVLNFGGRYVYVDDERPPDYNKLCDKLVGKLLKDIVTVVVLIVISYCVMGIWPLYCIYFKHQHVTILNTELPFMDFNSSAGYAVNLFMQLFISTVSFFSNVCIEFGACLTYNVVDAIPKVVHYEIQELETEMNLKGKDVNAKLRLRNILMILQDYDG